MVPSLFSKWEEPSTYTQVCNKRSESVFEVSSVFEVVRQESDLTWSLNQTQKLNCGQQLFVADKLSKVLILDHLEIFLFAKEKSIFIHFKRKIYIVAQRPIISNYQSSVVNCWLIQANHFIRLIDYYNQFAIVLAQLQTVVLIKRAIKVDIFRLV